MTEKLILITLMHENTPYFFIFPFLEIFRGAFAPLPPYGATPGYMEIILLGIVQVKCHKDCQTNQM